MMEIIRYPKVEVWATLCQRPVKQADQIEPTVKAILEQVRQQGDQALKDLAAKFDQANLKEIKVSEAEFAEAAKSVPENLKKAIQIARANIEKFHKSQAENLLPVETTPGVTCWRRSVPIEKIGLYIPGGSAPLFSTLLMLGVPAKLAGCEEILVCTPANTDGKIDSAILYTAQLIGIRNVYKTGGAQAIAAMANGTETIPKVDKIFGPGNQYVMLAKQLVQQQGIAIDMPAGPSEVLVIADETAEPAFVAADLLSQAEHGPDSQVIVLTNSEVTLKTVLKELEKQLEALPRKGITALALKNSKAILIGNLSEAISFSNLYAPEHLIIATQNPEELAAKVCNAGSVFLGNYSCESAGDYASGTNHTLPTNGYARSYSGVSLDSFLKKITFQKLTADGLQNLGPTIEIMAEAEGLDAHKNAVTVRLKSLQNV
jgi:histidinol dehydrogenase